MNGSKMTDERRYQECCFIERMCRRLYYLLIPFFSLRTYMKSRKNFKLHWSIAVGMAHSRMKWYYTPEEVKERFSKKLADIKKAK